MISSGVKSFPVYIFCLVPNRYLVLLSKCLHALIFGILYGALVQRGDLEVFITEVFLCFRIIFMVSMSLEISSYCCKLVSFGL